MQHSGHFHPEFGLISPTPRWRREMRIVATSLLFGGISGALCGSGVIALRPSDRAVDFAEGSGAPAPKDSELGTGPSVDARVARAGVPTSTAAPHASAEEPPVQGSNKTSAPAVAPAPHVAPKARGADLENGREPGDRESSFGPQRSACGGLTRKPLQWVS